MIFAGDREVVSKDTRLSDLLGHAKARFSDGYGVEVVSHSGRTYVGVGAPQEVANPIDQERASLPAFYHTDFFSPGRLHCRRYPTIYEWESGRVVRWGVDEGPLVTQSLDPGKAGVGSVDREEMIGRFMKAQRYLAQGVLEKLVISATRTYTVENFDPIAAVAILAQKYPFLSPYLNPGGFGASPELVAEVEQGAFTVKPLAGTAPVGEERRLMHSTKDRFEHSVMVDQLISDFHGIASRMGERPAPEVVQAGPLVHLMTELRGVLLKGVSLADVLANVTPTAAVSGVPRSTAMRVLAEIEGDRRGYGGCVGLIDSAGDGFAYLAIRGGSWSGSRVELRSGVGCVRESSFEREWEETRAKFAVTAVALGWR